MANSVLKDIGAFVGQKFSTLKRVAFSNNYNDLDNKPTIPTVPSVPGWALQSTKPKYTASEVGAIASGTESDLMKKSRIFTSQPGSPQEGDIYIKV